jgi:diguanylate cyclase (GGDEF)-like protein
MNPGYTLLVVDDEKHHRAVLTELLQDEHRVILAKCGEQAIEKAREHTPDLILLDVLMPDMSGFDVIKALKADDSTRNIPVIFISALDSATDEQTGLELGAVDYISKPFKPPIVRVRVRNHLAAVRQRRLLENLAMLDSLTEIPNRRRFAEVIELEWRRMLRHRAPLSLLVIDVDHFKNYNDHYGHAAGDSVLKLVAATLRGGLKRPGDFVARYGGEEFVVLLPEMDRSGGMAVAEQMRGLVADLGIPHAKSSADLCLTISIGGCTLIPDTPDVDAGLFNRADQQAYVSKQRGRNRVSWAESN